MSAKTHTGPEEPDPSDGVVFCVGVSKSKYKAATLRDLPGAADDARNVYEAFNRSEIALFQSRRSRLWTDPTRWVWQRILATIYTDIMKGSRVLFYYAGHGAVVGEELYLFARNTAPLNDGAVNPYLAVRYGDIQNALVSDGRAQSVVVVLDCCRAGSAAASLWEDAVRKWVDKSTVGVICLCACGAEGTVTEIELQGRRFGAFTDALINVLKEGVVQRPAVKLIYTDILFQKAREQIDQGGQQDPMYVVRRQTQPVPIAFNPRYGRIESLGPQYISVLQAFARQPDGRGKSSEILGHGAYTTASKLTYPPWSLLESAGHGVKRLTQRGHDFLNRRLPIPKRIRGTGSEWQAWGYETVSLIDGRLVSHGPGGTVPLQQDFLDVQPMSHEHDGC